jgi:hypothetical protein
VTNFYYYLQKKIKRIFRSKAQSDSSFKPVLYSKSTSTTGLRKHLLTKDHIDMWIAECKKLGIRITAKEAVEVITAHQGGTSDHQAPPRPQFTPERFIDALAEFIVATDQVFYILYSIYIFTNHIYL